MLTKLISVGNESALVIPGAMVEQLGLREGAELEVVIEGDSLVLRPVRGRETRDRLQESAERLMDVHDETLRKLR